MALVEASKILRKHLNPFVQYFELGSDTANDDAINALRDANKAMIDPELQQKLNMTVQELDLSVRANNCLESAKIADRARPGEEDRRGPAEGPQLRQDQPARSEAQAGGPGPEPRHGSGCADGDAAATMPDDDDDDLDEEEENVEGRRTVSQEIRMTNSNDESNSNDQCPKDNIGFDHSTLEIRH